MNLLKFLVIAVSGFGAAVSAALIAGFYGASVSLAENLCTRGGTGLDGCAIVSMSKFSSIKGIPLLGDIPIAFFGSVFFCFICFLVIYSYFQNKNQTRESEILSLAAALTFAAFIINIILYLISFFIIKIVCPLCVITYICVIIMLPLLIILLPFRKQKFKNVITLIISNTLNGVKNNIMKYTVSAIFITAIMSTVSILLIQPSAASDKDSDVSGTINMLIRHYESSEPIELITSTKAMSGENDAPISVIIFNDFTCPYCADAGKLFEKMNKKHRGLIRIYYIPIPLNGMCDESSGIDSPFSGGCVAALGAACAMEQNRFRVMYENLYLNHSKRIRHTHESLEKIAKKNGFDMARFKNCLSDEKTKKIVKFNLEQSDKAEIHSVPSIFINNRYLPNMINDFDVLEGFLEYLKKR